MGWVFECVYDLPELEVVKTGFVNMLSFSLWAPLKACQTILIRYPILNSMFQRIVKPMYKSVI